jgi:hypothetical protein
MEALNDKRHLEMVKLLSEAVDSLVDATETRGLAFDGAVKEYAEQSDNELSQAFKEYVKAMQMSYEWTKDGVLPLDEDQERYVLDERRKALLKIARQINVSEVTTFVEALIKAQDMGLSIVETLQSQAELLRQK